MFAKNMCVMLSCLGVNARPLCRGCWDETSAGNPWLDLPKNIKKTFSNMQSRNRTRKEVAFFKPNPEAKRREENNKLLPNNNQLRRLYTKIISGYPRTLCPTYRNVKKDPVYKFLIPIV
jgi:hypothetical protein